MGFEKIGQLAETVDVKSEAPLVEETASNSAPRYSHRFWIRFRSVGGISRRSRNCSPA